MTANPQALLDASITNLLTLAAFFADELGNWRQRSQAPSPEARACKEALLTISVLIPKLQGARYVVDGDTVRAPRCAACEED